MVIAGYGFNFLWADFPKFNGYIAIFVTTPMMISTGLFSIYFLETKKRNPLFHKIIVVFTGILALNPIVFLINYTISGTLFQILYFTFFNFLFVVAVIFYFKGFKNVRFYIFAWIFYIIGTSIYTLMSFAVLPVNFFTYHAILLGSALEITFFAFALADKINTFKKEKEKAQEENLQLVKEQS
jgi:hypothetical protein